MVRIGELYRHTWMVLSIAMRDDASIHIPFGHDCRCQCPGWRLQCSLKNQPIPKWAATSTTGKKRKKKRADAGKNPKKTRSNENEKRKCEKKQETTKKTAGKHHGASGVLRCRCFWWAFAQQDRNTRDNEIETQQQAVKQKKKHQPVAKQQAANDDDDKPSNEQRHATE